MFRKLFYLFFLLLVLVSCQNNSSTAESENSTVANEEGSKKSSQPDPVYTKGLSLVAKSDCLTCHKIDDKLIGPSYKEISVKYADAPNDVITALAKKIINGSVGNWGNVPMTPHPSISQDDAETMVRYILTLNK
ncbi:MAG: hypothetical protein RLZ05_1141 [Bacteroidota bacterium]|jgi:cytochrome c